MLGLAAPARGHVPHTVRPGETLWSIAAANGLTAGTLAAANGLPADARLIAGSVVRIPSGPEGGAAPGGAEQRPPATAPELHPHPTPERVTADQVGDTATSHGISRPRSQAIAWQESGFDNSLMSSAGARGVMQIMPATWNFIEERIAGRRLDPASASENVHAGVMYLHYLYHLKGSLTEATAAYFQGPNRDGWLPETHSYVHSVMHHEQHFSTGH